MPPCRARIARILATVMPRRAALPALAVRAALAATVVVALWPAASAAVTPIPVDEHGLPQWQVRVWHDFPVRIELENREALERLLATVPLESFEREQVRFLGAPGPRSPIVFEPRVTEEEAAALVAGGWTFERLRDVEREGREAMEATWRRQAEEGEAALRAGVYHTYAQIGTILQQTETDHPAIARRLSLGTSVQGRELWTIEITDNPGVNEAEPEIRLAGTIHGNEPPPQEMLLYLVDYLTTGYGTDPVVTEIVDDFHLFITPCLNPDGLTAGTRRNAHNIDLNRNYPVPDATIGDDGTWIQEPETIAVRTFGEGRHFVISENGHTGTLVVNYPWDYTYTRAPDDAALILLSLEYSTYNLPMYNGPFPQGITNGADWYVVKGSLQDWSYQYTGCIDVTIEISMSYAPPASALDAMWDDNRESFLHFIRAARHGIHGIVTDSVTGSPVAAIVSIAGNTKAVKTDPERGDYYKLLPTGTWTVVVTADGYEARTIAGVSTVWGTPTVLDVALDPIGTSVATGPATRAPLAATPNPFRNATMVRFETGREGPVRLTVFDPAGRRVRSLLDAAVPSGRHAVLWDGSSATGETVADGVYFVRLETEAGGEVTKLVLVR